ncbi:hypothetical protein TNCV_1006581 [Trichonephila clavipes]|nr:hypothetical protein TNCV_1006581 [Trichonephila clavipes]
MHSGRHLDAIPKIRNINIGASGFISIEYNSSHVSGARKEELILVADELGEEITPEMRVIDLKTLILDSDKYKNNKEFIDDYLDCIISDRKSKEEQARVTAESQLEFERINLEKVKLEIELGKINLERAKIESQRDSNELQRTNPETKQLR